MKRRVIRLALLLLLGVLLTGCWGIRELDKLALVMAVGVDKAEKPGRLLVTVQLARPAASGEGKAKQGSQTGPVYTASADGDSIFAAIRNLAQFTSRRIMWAHNSVVVVGESMAREDITPVISFFTRNEELRMRTYFVVARGVQAREVVAAKTGMETIPANSIEALMRYAELPGESVRSEVLNVAADFATPDVNLVATAVSMKERALPSGDQTEEHGGGRQVQIRGSAIFNGTRLVGFVDTDAGRGLLWLRHEMKNAVLTLPCPNSDTKRMAVEVRNPDVKITAAVSGSIPQFTVQVKAVGVADEQDCATPNLTPEALRAYNEREYARAIEQDIRAALTALQQDYRVDAIRFGQTVHVQHPAWWQANGARWRQTFPKVKVTTRIQVSVPKFGLFVVPLRPSSP